MAVVVVAGGWIGVDRGDRSEGALLRVAHGARLPVRTSAAVVAQAWRDGTRQANLARVLAGVDGGHLATVVRTGDTVLTGDATDLRALVAARGVDAVVRPV
jgi:hypothetical protein